MIDKPKDRYITTLMIADSLGVTQRSVQRIAKQLNVGIKIPMGKNGRTYRLFSRQEAMSVIKTARRFRGRPPERKTNNKG